MTPQPDNHWRWQADCHDKWDIFDGLYDEKDQAYYPRLEEAQVICDTCPVFEQCRVAGLTEDQGIWAGEAKGV